MVQMGEIALIDDKWAWDEVEKNERRRLSNNERI